ncbi:hypothetical protein [Prevotella histicola]
MRIIKNINSATACALYNKGVKMLCAALDSLTKGDRKKMADYLVVPNNCVLSLSLSLSSTSVNKSLSLLLVRARGTLYNPHVGKELIASFLCLICVLYLYIT